jgi:hypothetical protein
VKVFVRIVDKKFADIIKASACIPEFDSFEHIPTYSFKWELHKSINYAKTSFLFLIFVTIDVHSEDGNPNIVGYSFFPLFLDKATQEPATDSSEDIILHDGQYQLPVFLQDYPYALDFDMKKALELEKIPCCTVLIRVRRPPINEEGEPIGLEMVDKSLWAKEVWPPFKSYRENFFYCNKYITNSKAEEVLSGNNSGTVQLSVQRLCESTEADLNYQTPTKGLQ